MTTNSTSVLVPCAPYENETSSTCTARRSDVDTLQSLFCDIFFGDRKYRKRDPDNTALGKDGETNKSIESTASVSVANIRGPQSPLDSTAQRLRRNMHKKEQKPDLGLTKSMLWSEAARLKQGDHEQEFVEMNGSENADKICQLLHNRCKKNPGHIQFFSVSQLRLYHLPMPWRHTSVLNMVKKACCKTVKLTVDHTSPDRPEEVKFGYNSYQAVRRYGNGLWISKASNLDDTQPCPFKNCPISNVPHQVSSYIEILTSAHVVFDDSEAERTTVEFFYDDEHEKTSVVRGQGVRVSEVDVDWDWCTIICVTHDLDMKDKMPPVMKPAGMVLPSVRTFSPLTYVISHPHGRAKRVSFGDPALTPTMIKLDTDDLSEYFEEGDDGRELSLCKLQYPAPTCPGSAGAPVFMCDVVDGKLKQCIASHKSYLRNSKVGQSGTGNIIML